MPDLVLHAARIDDDEDLVDIRIADGRITAIGPTGHVARAADDIDCAGRVVIPGLVESHLHLDKALLDLTQLSVAGTPAAAITIMGDLKRSFTRQDVSDRARRVLDMAILNGTTATGPERLGSALRWFGF